MAPRSFSGQKMPDQPDAAEAIIDRLHEPVAGGGQRRITVRQMLLHRLRGFVRKSLLINDLRRSRLASLAARLLLVATAAPAGVRHDALLSIRRGFKIDELRTLLRQLDGVTVSVEPASWFRIAAIIRFKQGENA